MKNNNLTARKSNASLSIEVITALFVAFFAHSTIDNYLRLPSLKNCLAFYTTYTVAIAYLIIFSEAIASTLLIIPRTRIAGLVFSFLLMGTLLVSVKMTPHYPHDFGGVLNVKSRTFLTCFSIIGMILSLVAIGLHIRQTKSVHNVNETTIVFT